MVVSLNRGTQYRPQNTIVLSIGPPKKASQKFWETPMREGRRSRQRATAADLLLYMLGFFWLIAQAARATQVYLEDCNQILRFQHQVRQIFGAEPLLGTHVCCRVAEQQEHSGPKAIAQCLNAKSRRPERSAWPE